jgi:hypothetical protein
VPELGVGVVVEGEGADRCLVVVGDVQFAAGDALSEVDEREAHGPLVGDAMASHPGTGFAE